MTSRSLRDTQQNVAVALDELAATTPTASETELLSVLLVCEGLSRRIDAISTAAIGILDDQGAFLTAATARSPAPCQTCWPGTTPKPGGGPPSPPTCTHPHHPGRHPAATTPARRGPRVHRLDIALRHVEAIVA